MSSTWANMTWIITIIKYKKGTIRILIYHIVCQEKNAKNWVKVTVGVRAQINMLGHGPVWEQ